MKLIKIMRKAAFDGTDTSNDMLGSLGKFGDEAEKWTLKQISKPDFLDDIRKELEASHKGAREVSKILDKLHKEFLQDTSKPHPARCMAAVLHCVGLLTEDPEDESDIELFKHCGMTVMQFIVSEDARKLINDAEQLKKPLAVDVIEFLDFSCARMLEKVRDLMASGRLVI